MRLLKGQFTDLGIVKVAKSETKIETTIEEICDKLLANVVMESYHYEIQEVS